MGKKPSFLKRLKTIHASNPAITWAVAWVAIVPSLGSLMALNTLYIHFKAFDNLTFLTIGPISLYIGAASLLMGLALMPTTLLSIVSGFLFGWASFPFLVIAYSLASAIGYSAGKGLDKNSLEILLNNYPQAAQMVADKRNHISQLIFFVRLSPVIPFALSNLLFALIKVDLIKVIWIGLWGMLPRTLMAFTTGLLAESLFIALQERSGTAQIITVVALILISGWGIYRFFRKRF